MPLSKKQRLAKVTAQQAREVQALPRVAQHFTRGLLEQPRARVARVLARWLSGRSPDDKVTRADYRKLVVELRRTPGAPSGALIPERPTWVRDVRHSFAAALRRANVNAGEWAVHHMNEQARVLGLPTVDQTKILPNGKMLANARLDAVARDTAEYAFDGMKARFAAATVRGETFGQLTTRLQRAAGVKGVLPPLEMEAESVAANLARGLLARAEHAIDRAARTQIAQCYNDQAFLAIGLMNDGQWVVLKRWDARKAKNTCPHCYQMHGETRPLNGTFSNGRQAPPGHDYCLCNLTVWTEYRRHEEE